MKTILLIAAFFLPALSQAANINRGNVEVDGSAALTQSWSGGSDSTNFLVSAAAQYFLADRFSAGAEAAYAHLNGGLDVYSFGPVATKYFAVRDQMAPYVYLMPIQLVDSDSTEMNLASTARLGVKFFLTDSVAFGPALNYQHTWNTNRVSSADALSLLAQFAIHL